MHNVNSANLIAIPLWGMGAANATVTWSSNSTFYRSGADDQPGAGVREPRRPILPLIVGAVALPLPGEVRHACD